MKWLCSPCCLGEKSKDYTTLAVLGRGETAASTPPYRREMKCPHNPCCLGACTTGLQKKGYITLAISWPTKEGGINWATKPLPSGFKQWGHKAPKCKSCFCCKGEKRVIFFYRKGEYHFFDVQASSFFFFFWNGGIFFFLQKRVPNFFSTHNKKLFLAPLTVKQTYNIHSQHSPRPWHATRFIRTQPQNVQRNDSVHPKNSVVVICAPLNLPHEISNAVHAPPTH